MIYYFTPNLSGLGFHLHQFVLILFLFFLQNDIFFTFTKFPYWEKSIFPACFTTLRIDLAVNNHTYFLFTFKFFFLFLYGALSYIQVGGGVFILFFGCAPNTNTI